MTTISETESLGLSVEINKSLPISFLSQEIDMAKTEYFEILAAAILFMQISMIEPLNRLYNMQIYNILIAV